MTLRDALDHYHEVVCECDRCHYNTIVVEYYMMDNDIDPVGQLCDTLECDGWKVNDNDEIICPDCQEGERE